MTIAALSDQVAELARRLDDLESRFAFQDDVLGSISPGVALGARKMVDLESELQSLRREVAMLRVALGHDVRDEAPPPHY
ncbi:hypothetical protein C7S18_14840 [Ahniella affigens]|uniref:SlyX protein n=1 Tax=Ahniella affigens TaxID=2021234 RepID=A0A2P1PU64_9GAMM|nr:SlyX family protein [Ahniella affigens]AVP98384.1 hypothetical protein C7S18_14840 [Ahniella affigens]